MAKPKNTYTNLLDEKFNDIKLGQTGPGAEIEIITGHDDIGKGTYGRVFKVEFNGAACVARELNPSAALKGKSNHEDQYLSNCRKCRDLRHPNIIQFFGVFLNTEPNNPPIQVMEKMHCSLTSYIERYSDILTSTKSSILLDVAAGLKYLHCRKPQPIVHCYLSSNNVLLSSDVYELQAKISDVGLAQMVKGQKSPRQKSTSKSKIFMAPEISPSKSMNDADPSADVFSYGAVMLHVITQRWPEISVISSICESGKKESTNNGYGDLMVSCLDENSRNRPKVTDVLTTIKAVIKSPEAEHKPEQNNELHEQSEETNDIPMEKSLVQVNVAPQKHEWNNASDEKDEDNKQTSRSSRMNSQQDQPKEQKQTSYQDNELACHGSTNYHIEQENKTDDDIDRQQSNRDDQYIQDGNERNEMSDSRSVVKEKFDNDSSQNKKDITEQQDNVLQEQKLSEEENSNSNQLIQKDSNEIPNQEQVGVIVPKQDELSIELDEQEENNNKQKSSRSNSQPEKQRKKTTQATYQDNRKDDDMEQLSNRDDQTKKNGESHSNTRKKHKSRKKGQQGISMSRSGHYEFDQLGPKAIRFYNEGNTCFFNAMLQCIHQTVDLHYAIAEGKRVYKISTSKGPLTIEVTKKSGQVTVDMQILFDEISRQTGAISPHNLLQTIGTRNSRFGHGTQEDSHEVLRYLLSVLREEEIECIKQEILSHYDTKEDLLTDKSVDGETKLYVKECLSKVSKGICNIDQIFGSYLISTTICHGCKTPLQTTEFHLDLSLPMPEDESHAKVQSYPEAPLCSSRKRKRKQGKGKGGTPSKQLLQQTTPTQEASSSIPEVVKSQQKFNSHLQEKQLSHCSYSDTTDLKLETALEHSLLAFTSIDTLDEDNKFICQACSDGEPNIVLCCVSKQILIYELSPVLILHIKRFSIGSYRVTKDDRRLSFYFVLDMAPFCTTECIERFGDSDKKILYGLYAVVQHNGSLHGGHYTTYVRRRPHRKAKDLHSAKHSMQSTDVTKYNRNAAEEGEWYYTNDSQASKCNPNRVLNCRPYLLFYEMLPKM